MEDKFSSWFSGFADGEGSFQIAKTKSSRAEGGYLYRPMFSIGLRKDDARILYKIRKEFGLGCLVSGRARTGGKNGQPSLRWAVSGTKQCLKLIKHFDGYPLESKKLKDYSVWKSFVIARSEHGQEMPKSLSEFYYHRIREVREYNPVLVGAYEIGLREKEPIIFSTKKEIKP